MSTTTTTTAAKQIRRLSNSDSFKLFTWYEEHKDRLAGRRDASVVEEAAKATGIEGLKDSHIKGVRYSMGIRKRRRRVEKPAATATPDTLARLEALEQRLAIVEGRLL